MTECMNFPATVEEFMEQYKITDTEQIYTNGIELVPIFRMKQWFEHQTTVDVMPVVHGKWIFVHPLSPDDGGAYMCSKCEKGDWDIRPSDKFCKFCGAKMDKE